MRALTMVAGAMLLAVGAVAGWLVAGEQKRGAVAAAAKGSDWEALRSLIAPGFEYTFGGALFVAGD